MKNKCTKFRNYRPYTAKSLGTWKMFDNPTDNHTDIEVPLYYKLRFTKLKSGTSISTSNHMGLRLCDIFQHDLLWDIKARYPGSRGGFLTNIWFLSFLLETVSYYLVFNNSDFKNGYDYDKFGILGAKFLTRLSLWNKIFVSVHLSIPGFVPSLKVRNINQIEKYIDNEKAYLL